MFLNTIPETLLLMLESSIWVLCLSSESSLSWVVSPAGHTERAMLYHELEDGMYSVTSYFFAKVGLLRLQQGAASLHAAAQPLRRSGLWPVFSTLRSWESYRSTVCSPWCTACPSIGLLASTRLQSVSSSTSCWCGWWCTAAEPWLCSWPLRCPPCRPQPSWATRCSPFSIWLEALSSA